MRAGWGKGSEIGVGYRPVVSIGTHDARDQRHSQTVQCVGHTVDEDGFDACQGTGVASADVWGGSIWPRATPTQEQMV